MEKILVAIKNNTVREAYESSLRKNGFETFSTDKAKEVVEMAEKENPDLIIIDINLPKIEKLQLIEKLKKREKERKIPIIVYSRSGTSNHKEKAIEWEVTDFISGISMPLKQMVLKVKTHLGKEKSYYFNYPMESKEAVKEMAEDLSENYKCSNCGKKKTLNLIRDLSSGEKSFQVAFICFDCSVD